MKREYIVVLMIMEIDLVKFMSMVSDLELIFFSQKQMDIFLVSRIIKIHLFDPANGSCFCAACQLHKIA